MMKNKNELNFKKIILNLLNEAGSTKDCSQIDCTTFGYTKVLNKSKIPTWRSNPDLYCLTPSFCCFKKKANKNEQCLDDTGKPIPKPKTEDEKKQDAEAQKKQAEINAKKAAEEAERKKREDAIRELDKWKYSGNQDGFSKGYADTSIRILNDCLNRITDGEEIPQEEKFKWGQKTEDKLKFVMGLIDDKEFAAKVLQRLQNLETNPTLDRETNAFSDEDFRLICGKIEEYMINKINKEETNNVIDDKTKESDLNDTKTDEVDYNIVPIDESKKVRKNVILEREFPKHIDSTPVYQQKIILTQLMKYWYCFPRWFKVGEKIQKLEDKSDSKKIIGYVILGQKKYPETGTVKPDEKREFEGVNYIVFSDLTMQNVKNGETRQLECEHLNIIRQQLSKRDPYIEILKKFNIKDAETMDDETLVTKVNEVTTQINQMTADFNYRSDDFIEWNNFLNSYFKEKPDNLITITTESKISYSSLNDVEKKNYLNVSEDVKNKIGWKITVWKPLNEMEWMDFLSKQSQCTPEIARAVLTKYLRQAIVDTSNTEDVPMSKEFSQMRDMIMRCKNGGKYNDDDVYTSEEVLGTGTKSYETIEKNPFKKIGNPLKFSQIADYLSGKNEENLLGIERKYNGKVLIRPNSWILNRLNEQFILKDKIKLTLNETVLENKKLIIQEKVIKNRVNILLENTEFKSRKERRNFVVNLLQEALYLESQGFKKDLINEEFWDVIKGFFGDEGSQSVFKSFKTRMGEWLTSHLSPKKADGWIGNCVRKTIQDIDMEDVHLITDCKFLTRKISRSIVEKLDEKMSNDELKDEGLYDVVRGGMASNVNSAKFRNHIEEKVSKMICPILYDMSNRFDDTFEKMKKRTLNIFD